MSTRSQITTEINLRINDNTTQDITPLDVRTVLGLLNTSNANLETDTVSGLLSLNFQKNVSEVLALMAASELLRNSFYLIEDAAGNTRTLLTQAEINDTLFPYAIDVLTGEVGTYDINTDTFTATGGGSGVAGVTGNIVDNTDPANPVITSPYTKDANDNVFFDGVTATLGIGCQNNIFHQNAGSNTLGGGCANNIFENEAALNNLGVSCQNNKFEQNAGGNTIGDACENNIFEQGAGEFTFGNNLQNVTIRSKSGIAGQDFSASPTYDFLYNQDIPAEIYYAGDFYHKIIDATKHQYIVTNLTTLNVYYYGVGAIEITRADLQALQTASSLIIGQAYIIVDAVGNTAQIQVVAKATTTLHSGAINLSGNTVGLYDIPLDTYTASGGAGVASVTAGTNISITGTSTDPVINSLSDRYKTTSTTSNTIGNGSKTFTVAANLSYIPLQEVLVVFDSSNHMHGTVTSYSGTTLVVDIKNHTGSGTYTSWTINLDGTPVDAITGNGVANRLAYFTAAQVIDDLDPATYPSLAELSYVKSVNSPIQTQIDTKLASAVSFNRQTGSYTLAASDVNKMVEMNVGSANNLTVPLNSVVSIAVGSVVMVSQYGAGQTTIVAASGVTLRSVGGWLKLSARYGVVSLVKVATDEWYVYGALTA